MYVYTYNTNIKFQSYRFGKIHVMSTKKICHIVTSSYRNAVCYFQPDLNPATESLNIPLTNVSDKLVYFRRNCRKFSVNVVTFCRK